jgi:hypothetical protein
VKGLLHRLAARAVGTAVAVRSDARLPFVGSALVRDAADGTEGIATERTRTDSRTQPQGADPPVHQSARDDLPDTSKAARNIGVGEQPYARVDVRGSLPADATEHQDDENPSAPPLLLASTPPGDVPSSGIPSATLRRAAATPHHHTIERRAAQPTPLGESAAPVGDPAPLVPSVSRDHAGRPGILHLASHFSAAPATGSTASAETAAEEVHIHIGRIEVTAVHEAGRPRRERTPSAPAMSLDAYLTRRGRQ